MYEIVLAFITAFTLTYFLIPSIIHVARIKHLCDEPGERRSHVVSTPSLGGIGIFAGLIFSIVLWTPFEIFGKLQFILCAFLVIFLIGAKDDIDPVRPSVKLMGQLFAATILVHMSEIKLTSMYGIFGIDTLPDLVAYPLSIFTMIVIINAFNLIDGINGLSGSIATLICGVLGSWFFLTNYPELSVVAFSTAGAVIAFLRYNVTPAKIFMGDTGSLLLGLVSSILIIKFIEVHQEPQLLNHPYAFDAVPAVAIGILILPLFDTLRVFTMRILNGKSPFSPDRTHIHHLLIDSGLSHMQSTATLVLVNIFFIVLVFSLQHIGTLNLLLLTLAIATAASAWLYLRVERRKKRLSNL